MKKKVFASDFDGTLYFYLADDEDKLPQASVDKIKEYQAAGHLFGLCTGRQVGGLTPFISGKIKPDFYITSTGANIVDGDLNDIFRRGIDRDVADAIIKLADPKEHRISIDINGIIHVFAEMDYPGEYHVIDTIYDAMPGLVHQLGIHTESLEEAAALAAKINKVFGQHINAFQNVIEVDVAPKGCTKGEGVENMRKFYGDIKLYGIGDSINDLPLIERSDVSYTFPYAPKEVQKKATKIVDTIVEALEDSMQDED